MALNATVGASDANSYVTKAEADSYFGDRLHSEDWDDADNPDSALVTASRMLDWYVKWKGWRSSTTQSMLWPRTEVLRRDGTSVDDDIIPPEVKTAAFELAYSSLSESRTSDDPMAGLDQIKAGSLMIKAGSGGYDSTALDTIPEHIYKILSDLYSGGGISVVRLSRA